MSSDSKYIIGGGRDGRERLRLLSRVMQPSTLPLLSRAGLRPGLSVLDVACGGGDVACDMASIVGPSGKVVGTDIDEAQLDIARAEARQLGLDNIEFRLSNITEEGPGETFDLVYARFILTHLNNPARAVLRMRDALKSGGVLVLEDIDFSGHFSLPDCPAFEAYQEIYVETARRRGSDANIGLRLPALMREAGFEAIQVSVAQPAGIGGEVKEVASLTLTRIAKSAIETGAATQAVIDEAIKGLDAFAARSDTLMSMPRIVETWGVRPE